MHQPYAHPMMPLPNHDELARQNFVVSSRIHVQDHVLPGVKKTWEQKAKPNFVNRNKRDPKTRAEVRKAMEPAPYYQMWGSISRTLREQFWESFAESVERQLPDLIAKAKTAPDRGGSLRLDPDFQIPRYQAAIDVHCMPGSYFTELAPDDVYAGAMSDRGAYYHILGHLGARAHTIQEAPGKLITEGFGLKVLDFQRQFFPGLDVKRMLDIGCCNGRSTMSYVPAWPEAEIHAIDISAPELRYGHARTAFFGKTIHFSQQNGEKTDFPDGHFDLVVSSAVLHETSTTAVRNILKECHRLLRPGGVTIHFERAFYKGLDPFAAFMADYDTYYDNEPFKGTWREMDPGKLLTDAGFQFDNVVLAGVSLVGDGATQFTAIEKGARAIFAARK